MRQPWTAAVDLCWRPAPRGGERDVALGIMVAVAVAWIVVIAMFVSDPMHHHSAGVRAAAGGDDGGMGGMAGMPGMAGTPGMAGMPGMAMGTGATLPRGHLSMLLGSGAALAIAMWALMVVAMMLPAAIPAVRHVAVNSLRWQRRHAMATFVACYVSVWVAFGAVVVAVSRLWSSIDGAAVMAVALAVAGSWQLTVHKRRALRDCHRPLPLPPRGWHATAGVVRFASLNSLACLRSCWAMMLAMGVASSMVVVWMLTITGIVATEKLVQKPRRATRASAGVLVAGAVVAGAPLLIT
jgi:predicted metal-binding membrane protein